MLASLYVEPLWLFYRPDAALARLNTLVGSRIAIGIPAAARSRSSTRS
jgi:TRAP-type uncharacterized transport system substrate-binding protein